MRFRSAGRVRTLAKSTLRTVAGDFVNPHTDGDCFPSYEIVMNSERTYAFAWYFHCIETSP